MKNKLSTLILFWDFLLLPCFILNANDSKIDNNKWKIYFQVKSPQQSIAFNKFNEAIEL